MNGGQTTKDGDLCPIEVVLATKDLSSLRSCLQGRRLRSGLFRRLNQAIPAWPACAEVVLGQDKFSPLGSRLCRRQLYLRTNRCPPRVSGEKSIEGSRLRGRHLRHS
ncbi:unnamed protein product [Lupinus luteus]|uniref:Uncharacterized protein n=1 Tax=Lupinus luteus TaxID=3873 RepID=A0AAV1W812_LUPLU